MSEAQLDELSASWELESEFPMFRGISSLFVSFISLILLISLIYKIITKSREDPRNKPEVCKYCSICCGSRSSDYFECNNLLVLPAPLDVCICIYFLGFLTFLCNGYGIILYGNWIKAQDYFLGYIALIIFAVLIGFVSLSIYLYFYSMLILTISQAGDEFAVSQCTQKVHKLFMITAALCLPTGNIMMEIFGRDYGQNFRIGQGLAYCSFACVFFGISHLIILLIQRLELVLINSMSSDLCSSIARHSKTRTEIRNDVDNLTKLQIERDAQLLQVITKMLVITITVIIISTGSGIFTGIRYYFADNLLISKYLSLARWFWFTIINISFGAFCIYLTVGFNINLYKFWCRCDKTIHFCVMCCVKRRTVKKVTITQKRFSHISSTATPITTNDTKMTNIPSHSPGPPISQSYQQQNTVTITGAPSTSKMQSYSSMNSGSNTNNDQSPPPTVIQQPPSIELIEEEKVYDLKVKMSDLANAAEVEMGNLNDNDKDNKYQHELQMTDSMSIAGYTPNAFNHMQSEQL